MVEIDVVVNGDLSSNGVEELGEGIIFFDFEGMDFFVINNMLYLVKLFIVIDIFEGGGECVVRIVVGFFLCLVNFFGMGFLFLV